MKQNKINIPCSFISLLLLILVTQQEAGSRAGNALADNHSKGH